MNRFASQRVTIAEVAARAGVSKTTVSHVLSRKRPVAGGTRAKVEEAIRDLGYRPDRLARSLRTRQTHMVALIIPDITNPFYPVLARGLEDCLAAAEYRTIVCNTDANEDQELEFLADFLQRRVDAVVMVSFHLREGQVQDVLEFGTPLVSVGSMIIDDPRVDVVLSDDQRGAYDATKHLLDLGLAPVGMILGAPGTGLLRWSGYRDALESAALDYDPSLAVAGHWTRAGGAQAMRELMARDPRPRGVFCGNDLMAIGAMDAARELGVRIPNEVALVGYDDIEAASLVSPQLTTVRNPAYDAGRSAGSLLLDRLTGRYEGVRRVVTLPCPLVVRESA